MITSRQNPLIKFIRSLKDKKNRDANGVYLCEGVKLVREAYLSGQDFYALVCTSKGESLIDDVACAKEIVSDDVFNSISDEVSPQGVLAVVKKPLKDLSAPKGSCILLDGVSDPSNVGMIIRTAAAAGYNDIYLINCADAYSPKAVRASMSGVFRVKIHAGAREEILPLISLPIVVGDMNGKNVFAGGIDCDFCLVIGNEGHGVSSELRDRATYTVSIPMQNEMESLNAAVSAGILMYSLKN